jgi:tRNA(Ile)-lysidine synthase TilS/MesJ
MAAGNRHLGYKDMLNHVEERSPGTKAAFLFGFIERGHERFADDAVEEREDLRPCSECGAPTPGAVCAFCKLRSRAASPRIPIRVDHAEVEA